VQSGRTANQLNSLGDGEAWLAERDPVLRMVIAAQNERWPSVRTEDPIWGLVRIVMAQQVSTKWACTIAEQVKTAFPTIISPARTPIPKLAELRAFGLPERRAQSCVDLLTRADKILEKVHQACTWEHALADIKGIGPWTLSTFRVMVLREPDVLPLADVGLERAMRNIYGANADLQQLAECWRPYRSVACWYLWRTLGNRQLG